MTVKQLTGDVPPGIDFPPVCVIITTYKRTAIACQTLQGLRDHLIYPDLIWLIADDGSEPEHIQALKDVLGPDRSVLITNAERGGVGRSKNLALQEAFKYTPYIFMTEDDWWLDSDLDLKPHVKCLMDRKDVGMIRFGFLGGPMDAHLEDMNGPFSYYLTLKQGSGVYVYSGQISLRHKRFYNACGYHAEGVPPGVEEEEFCHRYNATPDAPLILWPSVYAPAWGPFANIGMGASLNATPVG